MRTKSLILLVFATIGIASFLVIVKTKTNMNAIEIFVTETGMFSSLDPLDADQSNNINVMRMLYLTPLEISFENKLISSVLSNFSYEKDLRKINFYVKESQYFSDGTLITGNDVLISILRMAFKKSEFPVIKRILGLKEWLRSGKGMDGMPDGLRITNNHIEIFFDRDIENPLFRFCLELFSIIPAKCIDRSNGNLKCSIPPFSGKYVIKEKSINKIIFEKKNKTENKIPDIIEFKYVKIGSIIHSDLADNQIISGTEIDLLDKAIDVYRFKNRLLWLPASRFNVLRFNPNSEVFKSADLRRAFAGFVRHELMREHKNIQVEKSLFVELISGFQEYTNEIQNDELKFSNRLKILFKGKTLKLPLGYPPSLTIFYNAIKNVALKLEMKVDTTEFRDQIELVDGFIDGKTNLIVGASGFWPQDPVGDLLMWFSKGLHKTMKFVWDDEKTYSMLNEIESETNTNELKNKLLKFNTYVNEKSLVAPISHFKRFYFFGKDHGDINLQSVASPYPWQLMSHE